MSCVHTSIVPMLGECCGESVDGTAVVSVSHYRNGFLPFANVDATNRFRQFRFCEVNFEVWDASTDAYATARSFSESLDYGPRVVQQIQFTPNETEYNHIARGSLLGRTVITKNIFDNAIITEWLLDDPGLGITKLIGRSSVQLNEDKPSLISSTLELLSGYDFPDVGRARFITKDSNGLVSTEFANAGFLESFISFEVREILFPNHERVVETISFGVPERPVTRITDSSLLCNAYKSKRTGSPGYFRTRRKFIIESWSDDGSGGFNISRTEPAEVSCVGNQFAQSEFITLPELVPSDATTAWSEVAKFTTQLSDPCSLP